MGIWKKVLVQKRTTIDASVFAVAASETLSKIDDMTLSPRQIAQQGVYDALRHKLRLLDIEALASVPQDESCLRLTETLREWITGKELA